ncbi:MAG TPA: Vms1/Ankzf1 family peptidyl-tRNA hydrolase, partial [Candidatus Hodarchaeales archaeon]|nr:Vms1/Ankzf1 family peptidyl-tRNA hydrolase [Candidatus Hodarchaeales archaeon]
SAVPKKHSRGGQSAPRFGRIRQGALDTFLKRVSNAAKDLFIEDSNRAKLIAGVIIGGPGLLKYRLAEEEYLDPRLQEKLLKTIDIGMVSDKEGLQELVEKSQDTLAGTRFNEERVIVQKWLNLIYRDDPLAVYGEDELRRHLQAGAVDLFLGSEGMGKSRVTFQCTNQTSHENQCLTMSSLDVETRGITEIPPCKVCGASMVVQEPVVDLLEELGEIATRTGSKVEIISTETEEGQQLLHFGGVAGVLRYLLNE